MFQLHIHTDNAAFEDDAPQEVARMLRKLADRLDMTSAGNDDDGTLYDINGNKVGAWSLTGQEG